MAEEKVLRWMVAVCLFPTAWGCIIGPGNILRSELSPAERAVEVYYLGQRPACAYDQLGKIEAISGTAFEVGTFESSVAKLQQASAERKASGVILLDHRNYQKADRATGMAIRCRPTVSEAEL